MVIGGFSPLFIILTIRGSSLIPDFITVPLCFLIVFIPNAIIFWRISIIKKQKDRSKLTISEIKEQNDSIIIYLFAMLLPLFEASLSSYRDILAIIIAIIFLIFVFWYLDLHYINLFFLIFGYNVFIVTKKYDDISEEKVTFLSKKNILQKGEISASRISNFVFIDKED